MMRLENWLKTNKEVDDLSYDPSLHNDFMRLRIIYDALTVTERIPYDDAVKYIREYYDIVNYSNFKNNIKNKVIMHEECAELINKTRVIVDRIEQEQIKSMAGRFWEHFYEDKVKQIYSELDRINYILSDPDTTREQALKELEAYDILMKDKENIKAINNSGDNISEKIRLINKGIQEYFIIRDMVTFGYFVERMDNVSVYAYDISVKYQREGMNKYVDFYKSVTTKLNTFGDYIGESINDGKQNKVYKRKFYTELYNTMKPYFYYGDSVGYTLYTGSMKIVKVGDNKFNVLVDDKVIEENLSYKDAYGKMEYFFSCHQPVIKGTRLCKLLNPVKDGAGNIIGLEGRVEQFLFPTEFYHFMDFASYEEKLDRINENFDKTFSGNPPVLSNWDRVNEQSIAASSDVEYTKKVLKDNYEEGIYSYFTNDDERKIGSHLYQHDINSINQKIDGAKKGLQLTLDEYTQRYNTINSNYDNMLRTITTMISELAQELKGFLRF
ncbi:hypothetical protein ABM024_07590 [Morganella morganii]|uniref:hypothetical protein n=1 Tax=Morganella morganii TaxID=582 RepID=UPI0032DAC3AC